MGIYRMVTKNINQKRIMKKERYIIKKRPEICPLCLDIRLWKKR